MPTSLAAASAWVQLGINDTKFREGLKNIHAHMKPTLIAAEQIGTALTKVGVVSASVFGAGAAAVTAFVKAAAPWEIERFGYAIRDLAAVIGQPLVPYMRIVTKYVREFSDWIFNLSDATKKWIAGLGIAATVIGALGSVFLVVGVAITGFTTAIAAALEFLGAILSPIGLVIVAAAGVVAAIGGMVYAFSQTAVGGETLSKVVRTLGLAFDYVKASIRETVASMAPSFELMKKAFNDLMTTLAPVIKGITALFGAFTENTLRAMSIALATGAEMLNQMARAFAFLVEQVQRAVAALEAFKEWRDAGSPQGWKGLGKAIRMKQEAFTAAKERASMVTGGDFGDEMGAAKKSSMGQGFFGDPAYQGLEEARKAFQIEALKIPEEEKKDEAAERLLTTNEILEEMKRVLWEVRDKPGVLGT